MTGESRSHKHLSHPPQFSVNGKGKQARRQKSIISTERSTLHKHMTTLFVNPPAPPPPPPGMPTPSLHDTFSISPFLSNRLSVIVAEWMWPMYRRRRAEGAKEKNPSMAITHSCAHWSESHCPWATPPVPGWCLPPSPNGGPLWFTVLAAAWKPVLLAPLDIHGAREKPINQSWQAWVTDHFSQCEAMNSP